MHELKYDLLFNYSRSDIDTVQQLASILSDEGVYIWLDRWELVPGEDWIEAQEQAMVHSRAIGVCVGPRRTGRLDVQALDSLLGVRQNNPMSVIITIILPGAHIKNRPARLEREVCIDFHDGFTSKVKMNDLIKAIFREDILSEISTQIEAGDQSADADHLMDALGFYEGALSIACNKFGSEHPVVATVRNRVGNVYLETGDLEKAQKEFREALVIDTFTRGASHPRVARDWNNLGKVLVDSGDWKDALDCFERALRIDEEAYGKNHPRVATILSNLGALYRDQGELSLAKESFERALAIDLEKFGKEHPKVAADYSNLAGVLRDLGLLAAAKEAFELAVVIFTKILGTEHTLTLIAKHNVSTLRLMMDAGPENYERVIANFKESRILIHQTGRRENRSVSLTNSGILAREQGDYVQAEKFFLDGLKVAHDMGYRENICVLLLHLGALAKTLKDYESAEKYFLNGLEVAQSMGHRENICILLANLGWLAQERGNEEQASKYLQRALEIAINMGHQPMKNVLEADIATLRHDQTRPTNHIILE